MTGKTNMTAIIPIKKFDTSHIWLTQSKIQRLLFYSFPSFNLNLPFLISQQKYYYLFEHMQEPQDQLSQFFPPSHSEIDNNNDFYTNFPENQSPSSESKVAKVITIRVLRENHHRKFEEEQYGGFDLETITQNRALRLDKMLKILSQAMNIAIEGHSIFLFYTPGQLFINFGIFPILETVTLSTQQFCADNILIIRIAHSHWSLIHLQMSMDITQHLMDGPPKLIQKDQEPTEEIGLVKKQTSIKNFQKIGYIVKKILSLKSKKKKYGVSFDFKNDRKLTKKSIDDYFYQIKQGYKYNFDFNSNSNKNMKYLREFVRERDECLKKKLTEKMSTQTQTMNSSQKHEIQM